MTTTPTLRYNKRYLFNLAYSIALLRKGFLIKMSSSKAPQLKFLFVLVLVGAGLYYAMHNTPRLGLDLVGGTRLTLEAQTNKEVPTITRPIMDSLQTVIENRVNKFGVSEAIVQRAGEKRLLIEIPDVKDPDEARKQLGKVGQLEFKRQVGNQWVTSGLSGKDLSAARLETDQAGGWAIGFTLNGAGTQKFAKLTTELAPSHEPLGIFFDGEMVSSPAVNEPILEGTGIISGSFSKPEAKNMVDVLNAGALPVNVEVVEETTVGSLLGANSLEQSKTAGAVGIGLVLLFMFVYYKKLGLVANLALATYTLLSYVAFMVFGVTFTLAGIAGFILSIGMAVDANILIFERSKEEIAVGKPLQKALQLGFDRALPSILDSNTTTLITCSVLWWLGTGSVKGFALTLALGVILSMFSAIFVTRTILQLVLGMQEREKLTFSRG
jgi:preprotein translocase subunit SecD